MEVLPPRVNSPGIAESFSTLIDCNLNDESVRKILKTQLRYEISNGLELQSINCTVVHPKTTLGKQNVQLESKLGRS